MIVLIPTIQKITNDEHIGSKILDAILDDYNRRRDTDQEIKIKMEKTEEMETPMEKTRHVEKKEVLNALLFQKYERDLLPVSLIYIIVKKAELLV